MRQIKFIMGMPIIVEIIDIQASAEIFNKVFDYFTYIDETFSPFKNSSELSALNNGQLEEKDFSVDLKTVLALSEETKNLTQGYFNIVDLDGQINPSGLVKGWAIYNAAKILERAGFKNFYVDAGGDIEARGLNVRGEFWKVGIQNPFNKKEVVKKVHLKNAGIATSGTYARGEHMYNPLNNQPANEIISLTVIGPNVYEADRFATAAFAMGGNGLKFIEGLENFEGYSIDKNGIATMTSNFEKYVYV